MKKLTLFLVILSIGVTTKAGDWTLARQIEKQITEPVFRNVEYDITDYGAIGDGSTDAIPAITSAVDQCSMDGGGMVVVPAGKYYCRGSVVIKSNVNLHFEDGAELSFSTDERDYLPCVLTRWEGTEVFNYSPMIYAYNVMNVAITGNGIINGNGKANIEGWKASQKPDQRAIRKMGTDGVPVYERVFGDGHLLRPAMVELFACNTILIEDVKIVDGTFWSFHLIGCSNATVRDVTVDSENLNSDGVDPESSRNVIIEGCYFHTGDDGIAVKSGRDQDGWRLGQPTENLIIRNCTFNTKANGLCIGSEISGGVRNVYMENCRIINANQGIYFKSNLDRGGYIENVHVRNIEVDHVDGSLIIFDPDYKSESEHDYPTIMRNFTIENVKASTVGGYGIKAQGFKNLPIQNVRLRNISVESANYSSLLDNVEGLKFKNVRINGVKLDQVEAGLAN